MRSVQQYLSQASNSSRFLRGQGAPGHQVGAKPFVLCVCVCVAHVARVLSNGFKWLSLQLAHVLMSCRIAYHAISCSPARALFCFVVLFGPQGQPLSGIDVLWCSASHMLCHNHHFHVELFSVCAAH